MEFDRLTKWIADTLSTDADDDSPDPDTDTDTDTDPPEPGSLDPGGSAPDEADVDELSLFAAAT